MAILTNLTNACLALEIFKQRGPASSNSTLTNFKQDSEFHLLVSCLQDRDRAHLSSLASYRAILSCLLSKFAVVCWPWNQDSNERNLFSLHFCVLQVTFLYRCLCKCHYFSCANISHLGDQVNNRDFTQLFSPSAPAGPLRCCVAVKPFPLRFLAVGSDLSVDTFK